MYTFQKGVKVVGILALILLISSFAFAVEQHNTVFPITETEQYYSTAENFYDSTDTQEIRFEYISQYNGACKVELGDTNSVYKYLYFYDTDDTFYSYDSYNFGYGNLSIDFNCTKGEKYYFIIYSSYDNYYYSIKVLTPHLLTVETAKQCSTSVTSQSYQDSTQFKVYGYGKKGFRPNGWKVVSGNTVAKDSNTYYYQDTIRTDTKLKLNCKEKSLKQITDKVKTYTYIDDFTEIEPSEGIEFIFKAKDTKTYKIEFVNKNGNNDYLYDYKFDSTFTKNNTYKYGSSGKIEFYITPTKANENYYFKAISRGYLTDTITIVAKQASTVYLDTNTTLDTDPLLPLGTTGIGDSLYISRNVQNGENFVKWNVLSGKGTFVDSTSLATYFIPKTSKVILSMKTKKLPIYSLDDTYSKFSYKKNSSQAGNSSYYGIRTSYTAKDSGTYAIIVKKDESYINAFTDTTFGYTSTTPTRTCYKDSCKYVFTTTKKKNYFLIKQNTTANDSIFVKVIKTFTAKTNTIGNGNAYINNSYTQLSGYLSGDTVTLKAAPDKDNRFKNWKVTSGSCKITDANAEVTTAVIKGDCEFRASFVEGTVYTITETAKSYTYNKDYYAHSVTNGNLGVRFSFYAPSDGLYTFNFSTNEAYSYFYVYKYSSFNSIYLKNFSFSNSLLSDTLTMAKGDSIFYNVYPYYYSSNDSATVFWVNYSTKTSYLGLSADSNGTASPAYYSPAQVNAMYPINATGAIGYRLKNWEALTKNVKIDAPTYYKTFAAVTNTDSAKIIAHFEEGTVKTLSTKKQTFNFRDDYFSEYYGSEIRFKWTPTDTNTHIVQFHQVDTLYAYYYDYGTSSFSSYQTYASFTGNKSFLVKGDTVPHYYTLKSNFSNIPDYSFTAQIVEPVVLDVQTEDKGTVNPSGKIEIIPNEDTTIYAAPYGGYAFKSWEILKGKATIKDSKSAKTFISIDSACTIQATYTLDLTTEPKLTINGLDLTNHPGICAEVSVTDSKNGRPIYGLDSSDFILTQDNDPLPIQVTTIQEVTAISTVLVVDESGSMDMMSRINATKNGISNFINGMGPYDRAAIIGFAGKDVVNYHQGMTSNKDSLRAAIDKLSFNGGTNIMQGTYAGIELTIGETNPTAVVVFSDGIDEHDPPSINYQMVNDFAKENNTVIYSIGMELDNPNPLRYMAEGTGGTYKYAVQAGELSEIYEDIRKTVRARYIICYQSPDEELNGDEHEVIISTNFFSKVGKDTAYWKEDFMPPVVKLTPETWDMVGKSQPAGDSLVLGFYIISKTPIATATVNLRKSSTTDKNFQTFNLVHVTDSLGNSDSLWQIAVPKEYVAYPGFDFYVVATDTLGFNGKAPKVITPAKEPYTIPIDNDLPQVTLKSATCMDSTSGLKTFKFSISDSNGVLDAQIYYKDSASVLYKEISLTREKDLWTANIPAGSDKFNKINYYVRAQDSVGTLVRYEKEGFFTSEVCPVIHFVDTLENIRDTVKIVNGDSKKESISRATEKIDLTVSTENFTDSTDTIKVTLSCLVSGDVEHDIKLIETEPGKFETIKSIPKNEYSAKKDNGSISCAGKDTLVAVYKDPAFGDYARDTVVIGSYVVTTYEFRKIEKVGKKNTPSVSNNKLDSVATTKYADFGLRITATSPRANEVDSIEVILFTQQGDSITVKAGETGKNTAEFDYIGKFYFVEDSSDLKTSKLDAILNFEASKNRIKILPMLKTDSSSTKGRDSLIIYNDYIPADSAEIYDRDLDGRADSVRIHFNEDLDTTISSIDTVFWEKGYGENRDVKSKSIKINQKDSEWIEAILEKQFKYGITKADTMSLPYLRMTKTKSDFSQKVLIADKIGVVPTNVVKKPGVIEINDYLSPNMQVPPDTLLVTLSEKIKLTGKDNAWKDLFRYSKSCDDPETYTVKLAEKPTVDSTGLVWQLILDDYTIIVGNCLRTNPKADYEDEFENAPSRGGVEITGKDGTMYLYEVKPVKPVSGIGKSAEWLPPRKSTWEKLPDTLSAIYVSSVAAYTAQVHIYDAISTFVASFTQSFGEEVETDKDDNKKNKKSKKNDDDNKKDDNDKEEVLTELNDPVRQIPNSRAKMSFLRWNQESDEGRKVGTGVYIWKIKFIFDDGHVETRTLKTGVKRKTK